MPEVPEVVRIVWVVELLRCVCRSYHCRVETVTCPVMSWFVERRGSGLLLGSECFGSGNWTADSKSSALIAEVHTLAVNLALAVRVELVSPMLAGLEDEIVTLEAHLRPSYRTEESTSWIASSDSYRNHCSMTEEGYLERYLSLEDYPSGRLGSAGPTSVSSRTDGTRAALL